MSAFAADVRVLNVRSQGKTGGAIFSASRIDERGDVVDAASYVVVRVSRESLGATKVDRGQWWRVTGQSETRIADVDGYRVEELQVEASSALLLRPSGEHVVAFLADQAVFAGIGTVKARKLWDRFGEQLTTILDDGDLAVLQEVLSEETARTAVAAWAGLESTRSLLWLQQKGFEISLGKRLLEFFGGALRGAIEEDPYRLLSFCARWADVDELARQEFGVMPDDPRRLSGAVEESGYRLFNAGHTVVSGRDLRQSLRHLLSPGAGRSAAALVERALALQSKGGAYLTTVAGIQPIGPHVMERLVSRAIALRASSPPELLLSEPTFDTVIAEFSSRERLRLNDGQLDALREACRRSVMCITEGAGVGKTTVLKALYALYDHAGVEARQVALAGRAAKRMQEATGRPAKTIASFLSTTASDDFADHSALVVDEASMVDLISMSRIIELLPDHVRLVLVGDPNQLMPVGPGLVFHSIESLPLVPRSKLTVVKRYGDGTAAVAGSIRDGQWPDIGSDPSRAVAFFPAAAEELTSIVVDLYKEAPDGTQILTPRKRGHAGAAPINDLCQAHFTAAAEPIVIWNERYARPQRTGLHIGDAVLCTRNMWDRGLQNGSLGRVVRASTCGPADAADPVIAWVEWDDGELRSLHPSMLDDIELGYAITVHKAQGSQWERVIVPVTRCRLLDRTLLYTAITRAQKQVVLVGDVEAARIAATAPPRAATRHVGMRQSIQQALEACARA